MKNFKRTMQQKWYSTRVALRKHAPEIALGTSIVTGIGAIALAIRQTARVEPILDEHLKELEEINDALDDPDLSYTKEQAEWDKLHLMMRTLGKLGWHYAGVVGLEGVSLYSRTKCYKFVKADNALLTAELGALYALSSKAKGHIAKNEGVDGLNKFIFDEGDGSTGIIYDAQTGEIILKGIDRASGPNDPFGMLISKETCPYIGWSKDPARNLLILEQAERELNKIYRSKGFISHADVIKYFQYTYDGEYYISPFANNYGKRYIKGDPDHEYFSLGFSRESKFMGGMTDDVWLCPDYDFEPLPPIAGKNVL